jgi:hypothetical protein
MFQKEVEEKIEINILRSAKLSAILTFSVAINKKVSDRPIIVTLLIHILPLYIQQSTMVFRAHRTGS